MDHPKIMVVIGEHEWTLDAVHQACALARRDGNQLVLLKMVPVKHHLLLGTDPGSFVNKDEQSRVMEYLSLVDSYAVSCSICIFQYVAYSNALLSAAEQLDIRTIFASFPQEWLSAWRRFKISWLKRRLVRYDRALHVLDQAVQT